MTEATFEQFSRDVKAFLDASQRGRVLVTQGGKPVAMIIGLENKDGEDLGYESAPEFWTMIEDRRRRPTISLDSAEAALFAEEAR